MRDECDVVGNRGGGKNSISCNVVRGDTRTKRADRNGHLNFRGWDTSSFSVLRSWVYT